MKRSSAILAWQEGGEMERLTFFAVLSRVKQLVDGGRSLGEIAEDLGAGAGVLGDVLPLPFVPWEAQRDGALGQQYMAGLRRRAARVEIETDHRGRGPRLSLPQEVDQDLFYGWARAVQDFHRAAEEFQERWRPVADVLQLVRTVVVVLESPPGPSILRL